MTVEKQVEKREEPIWSEEKLMEILSPKAKTDLEVEKKIVEMGGGFNALFVSKSEKFSELRVSLLKKFIKKDYKGVFVSVAVSGKKLAKQFGQNSLSGEKIAIIDATGSEDRSEKNVIYLDDQSDLTTLFSEIEKAAESPDGKKSFIILDSLNTFLVYNDQKTVEKFIHSIVSKLGSESHTIIFTAVNSREAHSMLKTIGNFCDYFVRF